MSSHGAVFSFNIRKISQEQVVSEEDAVLMDEVGDGLDNVRSNRPWLVDQVHRVGPAHQQTENQQQQMHAAHWDRKTTTRAKTHSNIFIYLGIPVLDSPTSHTVSRRAIPVTELRSF